MSQVISKPDQHYYLTKLFGDDYSIVYKPGQTNQAAGALSLRDSPSDSQLLILSIPTFEFLTQLKIEIAVFANL